MTTAENKKKAKKSGQTRKRKTVKKEPMDPDQFNSMIAKKAYELYVKRGCPHGNDQADWYKAEKSVKDSLSRS